MRYKWSPDVVDSIDLKKLWRILEETEEDFKDGGADEDDFM